MEREAPFFVRARSCRSLVERLCIAKLPKVPERSARPAGFHWGFTMVLLGFPWPKHFQNLCPKHSENPRKNPPQHLPKSMPKPPKIEPKTLQNRGLEAIRWKSLFDPKSSPLFSAPGSVLGRPGSVLGASWGRLGAAMGRLGASWERLGGVLGRLGSVLGRLAYTL